MVSGNVGMTSAAESLMRHTFQTSDGVNLSIIEAGLKQRDSSQPTIALIPGWCMPASLWRKQLEELGGRYHALALDPRGQGESDVPAKGFTAQRRAADIHEFLQPFSRVLLVGWSLGAIETLQYISMFGADRIAGLVIVDSSVGEEPAPASDGRFVEQSLNLQKNRPGTQVEIFREAGHALFVDEPVRFNALLRKFAEILSQR